jgi:hypothetical protein
MQMVSMNYDNFVYLAGLFHQLGWHKNEACFINYIDKCNNLIHHPCEFPNNLAGGSSFLTRSIRSSHPRLVTKQRVGIQMTRREKST